MKAQDIWDKVRRRGKRTYGSDFTIYSLRLTSSLKPRVVVSGKVDKRAVVRNKIRRRIKNILSQAAPPCVGLMIIAKPSIIDRPFQSLKKDLITILNKLK